MTTTATQRLIIHGRVQGVGYRRWTVGTARRLGLNGWVRNKRDGTVEMVISGDTDAIAKMQLECARGPLAAKVSQVESIPFTGEMPEGFAQLTTAD